MRKLAIVAVGMALFGVLNAGAVADAGRPNQHLTLHVTKVVIGERSPGTVVRVECATEDSVLPHSVRLGFDAKGRATVAAGDTQGWSVIPFDGSWIFNGTEFPSARTTCTFVEIDTGGAASVEWKCADGQVGGTVSLGCNVGGSAGTGPGPVSGLIGASDDDIDVQEVSVTFTNTFNPPPVTVTPTFTG